MHACTHRKLEAINEVKKIIPEFKLQINKLKSACYLCLRLYQTYICQGSDHMKNIWHFKGKKKKKKRAAKEKECFLWVITGKTNQRLSVLICYLVEKLRFNSLIRFCFLSPSLSVHAYLFKLSSFV